MPILMAKLDVAEAFRWLHHRLEDVAIFARELEGQEVGLGAHNFVVIYLAMVFGWSGAPSGRGGVTSHQLRLKQ